MIQAVPWGPECRHNVALATQGALASFLQKPRSADMREVVMLPTSLQGACRWRLLPKRLPAVSDGLRLLSKLAVVGYMGTATRLRGEVRETQGRNRKPNAGNIDTQTVRTTEKSGTRR